MAKDKPLIKLKSSSTKKIRLILFTVLNMHALPIIPL